MSYRSWAITIRPSGGVSDIQIDSAVRWLQKADYTYAVLHKHGKDRHIHASLFLSSCTSKSNLLNRIFAIKGLNLSTVEKKVMRDGVKIQYDSNFMENYMLTHDEPRVVIDTLPEDKSLLDAYYPEKDDEQAKRKFKGSPWFVSMEKAYVEDDGNHWFTKPTNLNATAMEAFIHHRMYISREIQVIVDPKRVKNYAQCLVHFLQKKDLRQRFGTTYSSMDHMLQAMSDAIHKKK